MPSNFKKDWCDIIIPILLKIDLRRIGMIISYLIKYDLSQIHHKIPSFQMFSLFVYYCLKCLNNEWN